MGGISLTASMRSNLLSLQNISGQVSSTQNKLSTGNKVNSAIDNPSSYYTALSLNNRADDLNALLDSMGQAVSTIKAATTALESATDFLEQASAVATQALETAKIPSKSFFEEQEDVAAVVSTWDELKAALDSGEQGNIVIYGNIEAKDTINLKAGQNLVGIGYYGIDEPDVDKFSQLTFDLETIGKLEAIKAGADNLTIADLSIKTAMQATTSSSTINFNQTSGHLLTNIDLVIESTSTSQEGFGLVNARSLNIQGTNNIFVQGGNITGINLSNIELSGRLNIVTGNGSCTGISQSTLNAGENSVINISTPNRAVQSSILNFYGNSEAHIEAGWISLLNGEFNMYDNSCVNIGNQVAFYAMPLNSLVVNIASASANLNINVQRYLFGGTGNITFKAVEGSQIGLNGKLYKTDVTINTNLITDNKLPSDFIELSGMRAESISSLDWLTEQNANRDLNYNYTNEIGKTSDNYQEIINQYDALIKDASYKGINLLQNDKLSVKFNEDNTASLNVQGKDMSSQALGFTIFDWQTQGDIADSLAEIANALKSIRNYSSELGNNYSIITTRQDFTESLVNVLTEGADKLTLADMNEESANMLALQTRQQLAINSLSLASQASQSILKLF